MQFTKQHRMRRLLVLWLPGLAAALLAGCGGSSHSSSSSAAVTTPPSTPSTTPATTPASTTATAPASTQTAAPAGLPICRATALSLSYLGGQGATGHGELGFALHNTSSTTCSTYGYPGIQFLDQSGHALPTIPTHTTQDFFGSLPKVPLMVSPGATVSFRLGVTHGVTSTTGCTTAYALRVIPPNDTATLKGSIGNGGAYECRTATVSPLQRGTTAYP